jgi:hypothetical protein
MTSDWSPGELELIDRYLAGAATPDEGTRAGELLARDPESARRYRIAVEAVLQQSVSWPDGREMWGRLWGRISAPTERELGQASWGRSSGGVVSRGLGRVGIQTLRHPQCSSCPIYGFGLHDRVRQVVLRTIASLRRLLRPVEDKR